MDSYHQTNIHLSTNVRDVSNNRAFIDSSLKDYFHKNYSTYIIKDITIQCSMMRVLDNGTSDYKERHNVVNASPRTEENTESKTAIESFVTNTFLDKGKYRIKVTDRQVKHNRANLVLI